MSARAKLSDEAISTFLASRSGWSVSAGSPNAVEKTFTFKDYPSGIAFVVRVAFAAEKRDHHPDLHVHWGRVRVDWSTHDAGGISARDTELAAIADRLYQESPPGG